ncbi:MAG: glutamate 5-kinase, partial [Corynebacterium casei]|nr:glutamate 5-kinase [Corynebacterium casei]
WKFWALYSADTGGVIRIDEGAVKAVTVDRHSLLSVGITDVDGEFTAGEIVEIVGPDGQIIGRGEVSVDSTDLRQMAGKPSTELPDRLRRPVVHADYLSNFASRV